MDGPGTITWEEFLADAEDLVRLSDEISDRWELRGDKTLPGRAYLARRTKTFVSSDFLVDERADEFESIVPEPTSDPFEATSVVQRPLVTEHHVLWSMSYGVPLLYFNAWKSGVNPVSVEAAQKLVPQGSLGYGELSQAMHPIQDQPFMYLHPCRTRELLQITHKSKNKLVSWLSAIAPAALYLKTRPEYYELTLGQGRRQSAAGHEDSGNSDKDDEDSDKKDRCEFHHREDTRR
ncbi:ubiquitin-like-conjugating enzyme ATG10 isoform X2 [Orussus abietinus]|uniref:ubiquitin-like-conjugating enzyme ATG10 isoform X2 n=1 Tax=Orussus abietinus TaxID=222816 RepID=UPI000626BFF9|nr:ubiquitin-like-conjugating enzyme ATG10 isoform X2 [Orussus abietinus]